MSEELMYNMVTLVDNTIVYNWKFAKKVELKCFQQQQKINM